MSINVLVYLGSAIITFWGIAHLVPTKSVIKGFGEISQDNRRIITMEWIAEGVMMIFIGMQVFLITLLSNQQNILEIFIYRFSAFILVVLAVLSSFTGGRTSIVPMRICPYIKLISAILILIGSLI